MSKSNWLEHGLLDLIFHGTALAGVAQNHAAPRVDWYISLHTASPGEAGNQTTNECAYVGYARIEVDRDNIAWDVTAHEAENLAAITFGVCAGGGPETATHFAIGETLAGADNILYYGEITNPVGGLVINNGITPEFAIRALTASED